MVVGGRWRGRAARVAPGASLRLSGVRGADAGEYSCRVAFPNRSPPERSPPARYNLRVAAAGALLTPPVNVTVREGGRAELECTPRSPRAAVTWLRGEQRVLVILLPGHAELASNGSLVITNASSTDSDEYECRVEDPELPADSAGRVQSASAFLDVQYKAKVIFAPQEVKLPLGKPASLDCHFSANPPLTNLRWEKDGFLFDPYNVPGVFYSRNGSLLFNRVEEGHAGVYSCTAYNSLGTAGPSPAVRVSVSSPPRLTLRPRSLYVARVGSAVTLVCSANGATVLWSREDGRPLPMDRVEIEGNLTIREVMAEDRGAYVCRVDGEAEGVETRARTELLVENAPPRAPYNLTAMTRADSIHLSWVPGESGLESEYTVWYRGVEEAEWRTLRVLSRGRSEATLPGLRRGTRYELRVLAEDALGAGLFSRPIYVTTPGDDVNEVVPENIEYAPNVGLAHDKLHVNVRLLDEGALVRWSGEESEGVEGCEVKWYEDPGRHLLSTARTLRQYLLVGEVKEGARYWTQVTCADSIGEAALHVPEYGRLRIAATAAAGVALLLAALAAAFWAARAKLRPRPLT